MGRTSAQEDIGLPVNLNRGDSLGASRNGRREKPFVDAFRWYHQYDTGSLEVASLARMSLLCAIAASHAPFCRGT
eukprot:390709-Pleurochrysis_carterae.AAC.4